MKMGRLAALSIAVCVSHASVESGLSQTMAAAGSGQAVTAAGMKAAESDVTLFRVFLQDGTALISYGEVARVDQRVVFSMPTSFSTSPPQLHLVNIPADRVDWIRTASYAETVRAAHYLEHRAAIDYIELSNEVARTLETVALTKDPAVRLSIVEAARKKLADWPKAHYNYKEAEVQQMLLFLDGAIADLRTSVGATQFALDFVASPPPSTYRTPLLPQPTLRESIELTLIAAMASDVPAERASLLAAALANLTTNAKALPADWAAATIASTKSKLASEEKTNEVYQRLSASTLKAAEQRARAADVRGLEKLLTQVREQDKALGSKRTDVVEGLVRAVEEQLDAARHLRLARDHWAERAPLLRAYRDLIDLSLVRFGALKPWLEEIKTLAGSPPSNIRGVQRTSARILNATKPIVPPDELRAAHAMFMSAANLADRAAILRTEAVTGASMSLAWDASSAAAGALMLGERAREDIDAALRMPQLAR